MRGKKMIDFGCRLALYGADNDVLSPLLPAARFIQHLCRFADP
jgi:hypothetical protein